MLGVDRCDGPVCDHQTFLLFPWRYQFSLDICLFHCSLFAVIAAKATVLVLTKRRKEKTTTTNSTQIWIQLFCILRVIKKWEWVTAVHISLQSIDSCDFNFSHYCIKWNASSAETASSSSLKIENLIRAAINENTLLCAWFAFKRINFYFITPNPTRVPVLWPLQYNFFWVFFFFFSIWREQCERENCDVILKSSHIVENWLSINCIK